jgi:hypothetical protein
MTPGNFAAKLGREVTLVILNVLREIVSVPVPGRYLIVELIGHVVGRRIGYVDGTVGTYRVSLDLRDPFQRQVLFGLYEPRETALAGAQLRKETPSSTSAPTSATTPCSPPRSWASLGT